MFEEFRLAPNLVWSFFEGISSPSYAWHRVNFVYCEQYWG